jgi:hypothetical protein
MVQAKLRIPPSQLSPLAALLGLSSQDRAALLRGIVEAPPRVDLLAYANNLAAGTSMDANTVRGILDLLVDLHSVMDDLAIDVPEVVSQLRLAVEQLPKEELEDLSVKGLTPRDWSDCERFISAVFSADAGLTLTAKAYSVSWEYENRYCTARILTDLRPVFGPNAEDAPSALITVHTLRLTYHQGAETKEVYVALDRDDIDQLSVLLERAKKKEESLKKLSRQKDIALLEVEP